MRMNGLKVLGGLMSGDLLEQILKAPSNIHAMTNKLESCVNLDASGKVRQLAETLLNTING